MLAWLANHYQTSDAVAWAYAGKAKIRDELSVMSVPLSASEIGHDLL